VIDATSLQGGGILDLTFNYVLLSGSLSVGLVGLDANGNASLPGCGSGCTELFSTNLALTGPWGQFSQSIALAANNYVAIGLGFYANNDSQQAGLDNVSLTAVAEPSTLLLLGMGLVATVAGSRRRARRRA
jgi:hypothetical protein